MEQQRRNTILELHRAGHEPGEIYMLFQNAKGYTRMTIYRVIKRYEKHGLTTRRRHTAKIVLKWLKIAIPNFWSPWVWPSNSPDANPCDCWLWSQVEKEACKTHHNSIESLKRDIVKAFKHLDKDQMSFVCSRIRSRLIEANSGHIEK